MKIFRLLFLFCGFFGVLISLGAQEANPAVAPDAIKWPRIQTSLGAVFHANQATELVYKEKQGSELESRLLYNTPATIGLQLALDIGWQDFLSTGVSMTSAWPVRKGTLVDDDWVDISSSGPPNIHSDTGLNLKHFYQLRIDNRFRFLHESFVVEPGLGFDYRSAAWDGFETVQTGLFAGTFYGQTFAYDQQWYIPWIALDLGLEISGLSVKAGLRFSPWMFGQDRDIHIKRLETFIDTVSGGWMLSPSLAVALTLNDQFVIGMSFEYEIIRDNRGDTLTSKNGITNKDAAYKISEDQAGMGYEAFTMALFFTFKP